MAKLKLLKLPKKPKANASVSTKQNYLKKVAEIKSENQRRKKEHDFGKSLTEKIRKVSAADVMPSGRSARIGGVKKRKSGPRKKAAKKSSRRKKR